MRTISLPIVLLPLLLSAVSRAADPAPDIVVAMDGSAKFTSIQSALESIPRDSLIFTLISARNALRSNPSLLTPNP